MSSILSVGGWLWDYAFIFGPLFIAAFVIAFLIFGGKLLDFIKSPAGLICLVIGLLYAASSFGYSVAEKECAAERARIEAASQLRDTDQGDKAAEDEGERLGRLNRQVQQHKEEANEWKRLYENSKDRNSCLLSPADLR